MLKRLGTLLKGLMESSPDGQKPVSEPSGGASAPAPHATPGPSEAQGVAPISEPPMKPAPLIVESAAMQSSPSQLHPSQPHPGKWDGISAKATVVGVVVTAIGVIVTVIVAFGAGFTAFSQVRADIARLETRQTDGVTNLQHNIDDLRADINREVDGVRRDLQRHRDYHDGHAESVADPTPAEEVPPEGTPSDDEAATDVERRLHERCRDADGLSCYRLARHLELGLEDTVPRPVQAVSLYADSCQHGYALGCYRQAKALRFGVGAERRPEEAAALFARACDGQVADACDARGLMRERGTDGQPPSPDEALQFYEHGCALGSSDACVNQGYTLWNIPEPSRDRRRARLLYESACDDGNYRGCNMLAELAARGLGQLADPELAARYRDKACQLGDQSSCPPKTQRAIRLTPERPEMPSAAPDVESYRPTRPRTSAASQAARGHRAANGRG